MLLKTILEVNHKIVVMKIKLIEIQKLILKL